ncbi:Stf0 family sulfotransferase [Parerythrobacter lacustris]|uniref:Stf0 family sulfotransferase n=1 Tax=Parerythrobacter lacustris TaxID=2969984 RepID=A0ABT1XS13_9SPHN|nr:Stf0 family sulfotransferase [Parerythrobacter lacustris]MCR2834402.1 Stf0 family sulfotransferase [Parerythrobacter lacustris]
MSAHLSQFEPARDVANAAPIRRAVIIASTQRSGSSLLGHYLEKTGAFGVPLEYFNQSNLAHWRKRFDFADVEQFLDLVEPLRTSAGGVFSIKAHYFQLREVGSIDSLFARYGDCRFVRITRRNLLRQAISRTVAQQTGVWISGQPETGQPHYDAGLIAANLRALSRQHEQWSLGFATTGTDYMLVEYEDLVADPAETIRRIASYCEVPMTDMAMPDAPPIKPQTRSLSSEWEDRFLQEQNETDEPILDGRAAFGDAAWDLARAVRDKFVRPGRAARWRTSPNLAPSHECD